MQATGFGRTRATTATIFSFQLAKVESVKASTGHSPCPGKLRVVVHPEEDPDVVYGGVMGKGGYIPVPQLLPRPRRASEHPVAMPQAGTKRVASAPGLRSAEVLGQRVNVASGGIRSHGEESPWRRRWLGMRPPVPEAILDKSQISGPD